MPTDPPQRQDLSVPSPGLVHDLAHRPGPSSEWDQDDGTLSRRSRPTSRGIHPYERTLADHRAPGSQAGPVARCVYPDDGADFDDDAASGHRADRPLPDGDGEPFPEGERSSRPRLLERFLGVHAASLDPGRPGLRVVLALGVLAAIVAGVYVWRSRPESEPLPPPAPAGALNVLSPTPSPSRTGGVTVYVTGKVRKPGVLALPPGARVTDAITAAGGLKAGAGPGALNLARRLIDGEHIIVGVRAGAQPSGQALSGVVSGGPASFDAAAGGRLDLNLATAEQLDQQLPGVGEVLARRIVEYREAHGGFRSVDQLRDVTGIGDRRFAELKDKVRV